MMAKDKIRPAAIKVSIRLEPGQRFGFHNFRQRLATFLINNGKDVKTIQGLLRRARASTTLDLYSQAIDESKLAAKRDIALAILVDRCRPPDDLKQEARVNATTWVVANSGGGLAIRDSWEGKKTARAAEKRDSPEHIRNSATSLPIESVSRFGNR